jgi:hypothetical protein
MKTYDPNKPIISLHIPKCAGQSFRRALVHWFGGNLFVHYFQQRSAPPEILELKPGICIHGHFNREKNLGADTYYPTVDQFITILRNPLDVAVSNYFFWKKKARARQLAIGSLIQGGEHDYTDIDDFFKKRPRSHILNFMPQELTRANYKKILSTRFVWIGLVERLQEDMIVLAERLGFSPYTIDRINVSERDEELIPRTRDEFIKNNPLEFEIYHYIKEQHPAPGARNRFP